MGFEVLFILCCYDPNKQNIEQVVISSAYRQIIAIYF